MEEAYFTRLLSAADVKQKETDDAARVLKEDKAGESWATLSKMQGNSWFKKSTMCVFRSAVRRLTHRAKKTHGLVVSYRIRRRL